MKQRILKKIFYLIILFNMVSIVNAQPVFLPNCPSEINTSQKLVAFFESWHPFNPQIHHYLSHIEMYEGHPEALVCLKPNKHSDEKTIWYFRQGSEHYIACQYNDTSIQLVKRLPPSVTQCVMWYKKYSLNKIGEKIPDHIVCQ